MEFDVHPHLKDSPSVVPTRHPGFSRTAAELATVPHSASPSLLLPVDQHSTQIRVAGIWAPLSSNNSLLQGQYTIEDKTTRTGETTHLLPLLSLRPQFKPKSLQTNLDPPIFAFCSPHPASLTQLDSGFNMQFLEIQFLRCPEGIEYSRHRAVHPRHQCLGFSRWIGKGVDQPESLLHSREPALNEVEGRLSLHNRNLMMSGDYA